MQRNRIAVRAKQYITAECADLLRRRDGTLNEWGFWSSHTVGAASLFGGKRGGRGLFVDGGRRGEESSGGAPSDGLRSTGGGLGSDESKKIARSFLEEKNEFVRAMTGHALRHLAQIPSNDRMSIDLQNFVPRVHFPARVRRRLDLHFADHVHSSVRRLQIHPLKQFYFCIKFSYKLLSKS